jgi:hypothetical protein
VGGYAADNGLGNGPAFAVPNGTPSFLLGEAAQDIGPKLSEVFTLGNVPAGTYGLYLYGMDYLNIHGTSFKVSSGSAHNGIAATLNGGNGAPAPTFVEGQNFAIFENVTPDAGGNIIITASPNPQDGVGNNNLPGETFVNGFQLIFNPPPTAVGSTAAQNVYAGGTANFSFSPAFAASPSFRWQAIIGGVTNNLSDGGSISGSATTNLTIANVSSANVGLYQCVISTATATNTSPAAPLTILSSTATGPLQAGGPASAIGNVLRPGDALTDIHSNTTSPYNSIPPAFDMSVTNVEDNTLCQYENFGTNGSVAPFLGPVGFIVTPQVGATIVTGLRLFTASSHPEDDPADYLLEGSNDGGATFTPIDGGLLGLPEQRNAAGGPINITNQVLKEIDFANTAAYGTYQLTFTNVNHNAAASNGVQIAEVQLLGSLAPVAPGVWMQQPPVAEVLLAGATFNASVVASGPGPISYQWYYDTSHQIPNATNATLTLANVQTGNGGSYNCVISNPYGSTKSAASSLTVVTPTPYEAAALADQALAYYPLDETSGTTAIDYVGDHDGTYQTNAVLGQPGVPNPPFLGFPIKDFSVELDNTNAGSWVLAPFGTLAGTNNLTLPNLTFTCWIYPVSTQSESLGLIFDRGGAVGGLDMGQGPSSQMLSYTWNNNSPDTFQFVSNLTPPQNQWSLAALTISPTQAVLYLFNASGRFSATNAIPHSEGLLDGAWRIGSDAQDDPGRTFNGMIDAVAVFTNTLSWAQLNALYDSGARGTTNVPPSVDVPSAPVAVDLNGNGSIGATVVDGPPPFTYQWYYVASGVTNKIAGATNGTLQFTDIQASQGTCQYYAAVSNAYGATTSSIVTLKILSGAPTLVADVSPPLTVVPAGLPITFSVTATGTEPFAYQWSSGSGPIAGATGPSYTFDALAGSNTYSVTVTNSLGSIASSTAVVVGLTNPPPVLTFNDHGANWTLNQGANWPGAPGNPSIVNGLLTLTDGTNSEACSAFFDTPQYIGGFIASFAYTAGGNRAADGTTFCLQDSTNAASGLGPSAVGADGGGLGYYGISNSVAFELNLNSGANGGSGIQFGTNGSTPDSANPTAPYFSPGVVDIAGGDPISVQLYYGENVLDVWLVDATAGTSFATSFSVPNLPAIVGGSSAFVGFTSGDGDTNSIQTVSNFVFSYTTPPILSVTHRPPGSVVVSWPVSVSTLFGLQQSTTLQGPWTNLTASPVIVNSENQVALPLGAGTVFYRLSLQ